MKIRRNGQGLIEVIITLFLTISIFTGFSQLIIQAAQLKNKTDRINQMTCLLINQLEELRSQAFAQTNFFNENKEILEGLLPGEKFICRWKFIPEAPAAGRIEIEVASLTHPNQKVRASLWLTSILGF